MTDDEYQRGMYEAFAGRYGEVADKADEYESYFRKVDVKLKNWYRQIFDWKWVVENLSHKSGLYAFYNHTNNLVYIGKSTDLAKRLAGSLNDRADVIGRIDYMICESRSDTDILELLYIAKYKPILNHDCVRNDESSILKLLNSEVDVEKFETVPRNTQQAV